MSRMLLRSICFAHPDECIRLRAHPRGLRGVSEHKRDVSFFLRIEDSLQLAAESFDMA